MSQEVRNSFFLPVFDLALSETKHYTAPFSFSGRESSLRSLECAHNCGDVDADYPNQFCVVVLANGTTELYSKAHDEELSTCCRDSVVRLAELSGYSVRKKLSIFDR